MYLMLSNWRLPYNIYTVCHSFGNAFGNAEKSIIWIFNFKRLRADSETTFQISLQCFSVYFNTAIFYTVVIYVSKFIQLGNVCSRAFKF